MLGFGKNVIQVVDEAITDALLQRIKVIGDKIHNEREAIDIGELLKILKKVSALEKEVLNSICDKPEEVKEAPSKEQSDLQKSIEDYKID